MMTSEEREAVIALLWEALGEEGPAPETFEEVATGVKALRENRDELQGAASAYFWAEQGNMMGPSGVDALNEARESLEKLVG